MDAVRLAEQVGPWIADSQYRFHEQSLQKHERIECDWEKRMYSPFSLH